MDGWVVDCGIVPLLLMQQKEICVQSVWKYSTSPTACNNHQQCVTGSTVGQISFPLYMAPQLQLVFHCPSVLWKLTFFFCSFVFAKCKTAVKHGTFNFCCLQPGNFTLLVLTMKWTWTWHLLCSGIPLSRIRRRDINKTFKTCLCRLCWVECALI